MALTCSHCECSEGWLEPLLFHVHKSNTSIACPIIDQIHAVLPPPPSSSSHFPPTPFPPSVCDLQGDLRVHCQPAEGAAARRVHMGPVLLLGVVCRLPSTLICRQPPSVLAQQRTPIDPVLILGYMIVLLTADALTHNGGWSIFCATSADMH